MFTGKQIREAWAHAEAGVKVAAMVLSGPERSLIESTVESLHANFLAQLAASNNNDLNQAAEWSCGHDITAY